MGHPGNPVYRREHGFFPVILYTGESMGFLVILYAGSREAACFDTASREAMPAAGKPSSPGGTPERKAKNSKDFLTILLVALEGTGRGLNDHSLRTSVSGPLSATLCGGG